jgi:hypothetical protein
MHQSRRAHDVAAEVLHQRLVAKADAQYRQGPLEGRDHLERYAGVFGPAGPWRYDEMRCIELPRCVYADRIVALHEHLGTERAKCLHQVVGE